MHPDEAGLRDHPFHKKGSPTTFVRYRSQQEAFRFLGRVLTDDRGVGLLHGPESSGKSVLVQQFVREMRTDQTVAVVDGAHLEPADLLSRVLAQFGYDVELASIGELMSTLNAIAVQQTRLSEAPLLILENINDMVPGALSALCNLASLSINHMYALRIVLTSNRDFHPIIESPSMSAISQRMIGAVELEALTAKEARNYLYSKLRSSGVDRPDDIFSIDTCDKIFIASGGWPGKLDDIARSVIETSTVKMSSIEGDDGDLPVLVEEFDNPKLHADDKFPKFIVTKDGKSLQDLEMANSRALIGRSEVCDIVVDDQFVSKQHALLIHEQGVVVLMDLKSKNGTIVNSRLVQRTVLRDNDIISLGDHRMKMIYENREVPQEIDRLYLADTARMMSVADARREKNRKEKRAKNDLDGRAPSTPRR